MLGARQAELRAWLLLAQALHGSNYLFIYAGERGTPIGTDTYWAVGIEEHYYAVFPLLALVTVRRHASRRLRAAGLLVLCCAALAWRWAYVTLVAPEYFHSYLRTYLATDMRVDGILCGAALAVRPPRLLQVRPLVWLGAVSYAAYLTHRAVPETLERLLGSQSALLGFGGLR